MLQARGTAIALLPPPRCCDSVKSCVKCRLIARRLVYRTTPSGKAVGRPDTRPLLDTTFASTRTSYTLHHFPRTRGSFTYIPFCMYLLYCTPACNEQEKPREFLGLCLITFFPSPNIRCIIIPKIIRN